MGYEHGKLLKELGFNINFAPVVDLEDNIWHCRSFPGTPEEIAVKSNHYIKGLQESPYHFITSVTLTHHADPRLAGAKAHRSEKEIWGRRRTVVITSHRYRERRSANRRGNWIFGFGPTGQSSATSRGEGVQADEESSLGGLLSGFSLDGSEASGARLLLDVGTAVEMGYMYGCGKVIFGYTNVSADYAERVMPDDFMIESFELVDNLMVEGPVYRSGAIVVRADVPPDEVYTSLDGFTQCVRQAARLLLHQGD